MFKFLNCIPVVGHLKAACHYIADDAEAGNEAMYDASRSAIVTIGGICGTFAGPVGMGAGAVLAGALTDLFVSDFSKESKGLIKDLGDVFDEDGNRVEGALNLGLTITLDAVTGGVTGKIYRSATKGVVKIAGTAAVDVVGAEITKKIRKSKKKARAHAPMAHVQRRPRQSATNMMKIRDVKTGQEIEISL